MFTNISNWTDEQLTSLITTDRYDAELFAAADSLRRAYYGEDVYIRGLIEFTKDVYKRQVQTKDGHLSMTVGLEKLAPNQLLYTVEGKNKAVRYCSDTCLLYTSLRFLQRHSE